mmetsp:Transcript_12679/g.18636  ORF Transcript_12679/g.18636 Transcript_12679/m.18636 type:complete len:150 (-) Transcript_12679:95-544(-)
MGSVNKITEEMNNGRNMIPVKSNHDDDKIKPRCSQRVSFSSHVEINEFDPIDKELNSVLFYSREEILVIQESLRRNALIRELRQHLDISNDFQQQQNHSILSKPSQADSSAYSSSCQGYKRGTLIECDSKPEFLYCREKLKGVSHLILD